MVESSSASGQRSDDHESTHSGSSRVSPPELERQAAQEGVSLQHYILYSLTRFVSAPDLISQKVSFEEMANRYPQEQADAAIRDLLSSRKAS
jgi:hypothetical protein